MIALLASSRLSWGPVWEILSKPDNLPILIMLGMVGFFTYWSFSMALRNDRLKRETGDPTRDIFYPPEEAKFPTRVHVWPWLLRVEFLCALIVMILLIVWSVALDAPLEDPSNGSLTPNPSKAPWYFLGLQEMLVYFDPWIAGVMMPTLIIVGLMAIPYIDVNPKGNGYYTWTERKFAITTFCFGFFVLWTSLIVIGTLLRGPGWNWFWLGQFWDPHAVAAQSNVDLSELMGVPTKTPLGHITFAHMAIGATAIVAYFTAGMVAPYLWLKARGSETLARMGLARYAVTAFLGVSMLALPVKLILRLTLNVKYVLVTPFFSV